MDANAPLLSPDFLRRLEALELVARRVRARRLKGERLSRRKGRGAEFADYRPYCSGDDLRFLDWNLYGRLEKLFVRLFQEDEELHVTLLIDASPSMRFGLPTKLRYAQQVAAALGFVGLGQHDRVTVETTGAEPAHRTNAFRGRSSLRRLIAFLDGIPADAAPSPLSADLRAFAGRATGRGLCVVLSDFLDKGGYQEGLRALAARGLEVVAVQLLAPEELDPTMVGDLKLTDAEDGDEAEITVSAPMLAHYKAALGAHQQELHRFCTSRGITFVTTNTAVPFESLVLNSLRGRGLLR